MRKAKLVNFLTIDKEEYAGVKLLAYKMRQELEKNGSKGFETLKQKETEMMDYAKKQMKISGVSPELVRIFEETINFPLDNVIVNMFKTMDPVERQKACKRYNLSLGQMYVKYIEFKLLGLDEIVETNKDLVKGIEDIKKPVYDPEVFLKVLRKKETVEPEVLIGDKQFVKQYGDLRVVK